MSDDGYDRIRTHCIRCTPTPHYVRGHHVADGLAIANLADTPHNFAGWSVTHTPSGLAIIYVCCENEARRLAVTLTGLGIDWTLNAEDMDGNRILKIMNDAGLAYIDVHLCDDHPDEVPAS